MPFEPIGNLIMGAAKKHGIANEMYAAKVCNDFRVLMPDLFKGLTDASTYIDAGSYKNFNLTIKVSSSAWAQEVITRKPKIIAAINEKAGRKVIKNLYTKLSY